MFQTTGMLLQYSISYELLVKLIYTKLSIQGIVHCIVENKCSLRSKWMFNLISLHRNTGTSKQQIFDIIFYVLLKYLVGIEREMGS
jgi:hypothetical protein